MLDRALRAVTPPDLLAEARARAAEQLRPYRERMESATYEQTLEAISIGVTHMTHCCNAMRPLYHRDPGPLGAVARAPQVMGELIADGVHVHPAVAAIVGKIFGPERLIVITDTSNSSANACASIVWRSATRSKISRLRSLAST